jgi:hypothetical protein
VLVGFFGPYGCHPSQDSIAARLGILQQQVSREVKHLVRAGLIRTEAGAYRKANQRRAATTYHFRRHHLFFRWFVRSSSRAVNEIADFSQQFERDDMYRVNFGPTNPILQQDSGILTTQSVVVEPMSALVGWAVGKKELPNDPVGYYVTRYVECVSGCGGCRIEYADGTIKRYECSCDTPTLLEAVA